MATDTIPLLFWTLLGGFLLAKLYNRLSCPACPPNLPSSEKQRTFGSWDPTDFRVPQIAPRELFDIDITAPLPFRPFRYGTYRINMGISSMPWNDWIQLDSEYRRTLSIRLARTRQTQVLVNITEPGFHPHALEALSEIAAFLALRYPELFRVKRRAYDAADERTWGESVEGKEAGAVMIVENLVTGESWDFDEIEREEGVEWDPMRVAGLLIQDDISLMVENELGEYVLRGGSICTAGSWRLVDKIGTTLDSIHTRGGVAGWKEKLNRSTEKFFLNLKVDKPVQRNNYFFQTNDELAWDSSAGPEDAFDEARHCASPERLPTSSNPGWKPEQKIKSVDAIHFRTERQTLRRMPKTGCIMFTSRTYLTPVTAISSEPGVPGRMASALRGWPDAVQKYKGAHKYLDVLLPFLDEEHDKQEKAGIITVDEEGEPTEAKPYPF